MRIKSALVGWVFIFIVISSSLYFAYSVWNIFNKKSQPEVIDSTLVSAFDYKYTISELSMIKLMTSDLLQYQPWVQFGNSDLENKYSIVRNGKRNTITSNKCKGVKQVVWFFGGSTMYGIGIPWWDTIPSKFVEFSSRNGVCFEAVNYGIPYFFSKQEIVYFLTELANSSSKPNLVIFLDGLNDFGQPGSSINGIPFFTPSLELAIPHAKTINKDNPETIQGYYRKIKAALFNYFAGEDLGSNPSRINYSVPADYRGKAAQLASKAIVKNYLNNRILLSEVCNGYKISCIQFIQPISIKDYYPKNNDDSLTQYVRENKDFENQRNIMLNGYNLIIEMLNQGRIIVNNYTEIYDISNIFLEYSGHPYIDSGHYSPRASSLIAEKIYHKITK